MVVAVVAVSGRLCRVGTSHPAEVARQPSSGPAGSESGRRRASGTAAGPT